MIIFVKILYLRFLFLTNNIFILSGQYFTFNWSVSLILLNRFIINNSATVLWATCTDERVSLRLSYIACLSTHEFQWLPQLTRPLWEGVRKVLRQVKQQQARWRPCLVLLRRVLEELPRVPLKGAWSII